MNGRRPLCAAFGLRQALGGAAAAIVLAFSAACESSFVGSSSPSLVSCQVATSMPSAPVGPGGGRGSLQVSALPECSWSITPGVNWITSVAPSAGQGDERVTFEVAANTGTEARQGNLVINNQRITVSQEAAPPPPPPPPPPAPAPPPPGPAPPPAPAPCVPTLALSSANIGAGGGSVAVGVTLSATCTWTATSSVPWITPTSPATGIGSFVLTLTVAANGGPPRSGTVSVSGVVFTVSQAGNCTFDVKPGRFRNVDEDGQTGLRVTVGTAAGCAWTATSQAPWITITSGAAGSGSGAVVFSVAANPGAERTGTLTVAGQTVRVDQDED